jgi:hypothetical protein
MKRMKTAMVALGLLATGAVAGSVFTTTPAYAELKAAIVKRMLKTKAPKALGDINLEHHETGRKDGEHTMSLTLGGIPCVGFARHDGSHKGTFEFICADGGIGNGTYTHAAGPDKIAGHCSYKKPGGETVEFDFQD